MNKRKHRLIAIVIAFTLVVMTSAQGMQVSVACVGRTCCCATEAVHHIKADLSAPSSSGCHGQGPCCQVQGERPPQDVAMTTSMERTNWSPVSLASSKVSGTQANTSCAFVSWEPTNGRPEQPFPFIIKPFPF